MVNCGGCFQFLKKKKKKDEKKRLIIGDSSDQSHETTEMSGRQSSSIVEGYKVINGVHELYTITAGMMLGLRYAIGHSIDVLPIQNSDPNFHDVEKIAFPPGGNSQPPFKTPPHHLDGTFVFKTYAPLVFKRLRDFYGVDSVSYMLSVCGNSNYLEFISNSKSGQFFFFSHEGKYMIKTQTFDEFKFMKRILPQYFKYVTENPHTFLVRIYGMHRVRMHYLNRKTHFVVYQSVFDTPEHIDKMYDLKGSLIGRNASKKDRESGGVLKDQDLIDDGVKLKLGPKRELILEQLEKDANFLAELNIMDYSVLLGIHDGSKSKRDQESASSSSSGVPMKSSSLRKALRRQSIMIDKNALGNDFTNFKHEPLSKRLIRSVDVKKNLTTTNKNAIQEGEEDDDDDDEDEEEEDQGENDNGINMFVDEGTIISSLSSGSSGSNSGGATMNPILSNLGITDSPPRSTSQHVSRSPRSNRKPVRVKSTDGMQQNPWTGRLDGGIVTCGPDGEEGSDIYYMGVIDILQQYNAAKRFETHYKGLTYDKTQISSVDSKTYARRFVQFMRDNSM